jgi:outer membrane murein-binding lipoprotein Lpp
MGILLDIRAAVKVAMHLARAMGAKFASVRVGGGIALLAEGINAMGSKAKLITLALVPLLIICGCKPGAAPDEKSSTEQEAAAKLEQMREMVQNPPAHSEAEMQTAREATESVQPQIPLPKYAPPAPLTGHCRRLECASQQVWFSRSDWPKAWRGDYQGQRKVASCRANGCGGAVKVDPIEGCAWRLVINSMNADKADEGDVSNLQHDCSGLDPAENDLAETKAGIIIGKIRK